MKLSFNASIFLLLFLWQPVVTARQFEVFVLTGGHEAGNCDEDEAATVRNNVFEAFSLLQEADGVLQQVTTTKKPYYNELFQPISISTLRDMAQKLRNLNNNVFKSAVKSIPTIPLSNPGNFQGHNKILFVCEEVSQPGQMPLYMDQQIPEHRELLILKVPPYDLRQNPGNAIEIIKAHFQTQRQTAKPNSVIFPVRQPRLVLEMIQIFLTQNDAMENKPLVGTPAVLTAQDVAQKPPKERIKLPGAWIYWILTAVGDRNSLLGGAEKPLPKTPDEATPPPTNSFLSRFKKSKKPTPPGLPPSHSESSLSAAAAPPKSRLGFLSRFRNKKNPTTPNLSASRSEAALTVARPPSRGRLSRSSSAGTIRPLIRPATPNLPSPHSGAESSHGLSRAGTITSTTPLIRRETPPNPPLHRPGQKRFDANVLRRSGRKPQRRRFAKNWLD